MAGQRVHIVMEPELVAAVDRAKGVGESRGHFVRRMLEQALGGQGSGDTRQSTGSGSAKETRATESPAPARASRPVSDQQRWAMERQRKLNERKS